MTENEKREPVVTSKVRVKKKTFLDMCADVVKNGVKTAFKNVIIPNVQRATADFIATAADAIIFGDGNRRDRRYDYNNVYGGYSAPKISYNTYGPQSQNNTVNRDYMNNEDLMLMSRSDAEMILDRLQEEVNKYGQTSIASMKEYAGLPTNYTDNKFGWRDLRNAQILRMGNEYMLKMPKSYPLD